MMPCQYRITRALLLILLLSAENLFGQKHEGKSTSWFGYPVAFRLPETRWGGGAYGTVQFDLDSKDTISPASQIQLGVAFTQNKQMLISAPFSFFRKERTQIIQGEAGYYDAAYPYFGTGFDHSGEQSERYNVEHAQFRISFMQKVTGFWYAGARWWYDDYNLTSIPSGGMLETTMVTGYKGSRTSNPGLVVLFDSRDNVFLSRKGIFLELSWNSGSEITGSEYPMDRYRIDLRKYVETGAKSSLAFQGFGEMVRGSVPFNHLASVGGAKRMRGYFEGHFRDRNIMMLQSEWRTGLWKRFGLAVFAHSAVLANDLGDFSTKHMKPAGGIGLRYLIDPNRKLNLRLDFAQSTEASLFYLTVGEAF